MQSFELLNLNSWGFFVPVFSLVINVENRNFGITSGLIEISRNAGIWLGKHKRVFVEWRVTKTVTPLWLIPLITHMRYIYTPLYLLLCICNDIENVYDTVIWRELLEIVLCTMVGKKGNDNVIYSSGWGATVLFSSSRSRSIKMEESAAGSLLLPTYTTKYAIYIHFVVLIYVMHMLIRNETIMQYQ